MYDINITDTSGKRVSVGKRFKTKAKAEDFKDIITGRRAVAKTERKRKLLSMNPRVVKIKKRSK